MDTPRCAILLALFSTACAYSGESQEGFGTDFEAASKLATETGRPLLVHFYADYCPPCRRMEREVLHDPELTRQLGKLVVAVKVNTADRPDLAQRFGVDRIPHDRVFAPDGKELIRAGGFIEKRAYLAKVRTAVETFAAKQAADTKVVEPRRTVAVVAPTGLDGFCPVALHKERKWLKGQTAHEVEYKGVKYRLHSTGNLAAFNKDPEKYAPQILGCDPVVLAASHRAIPGRTDYGAFFDGKLYLFESSANRTQFKKSPLKYVRIRHALDVSRIHRTAAR